MLGGIFLNRDIRTDLALELKDDLEDKDISDGINIVCKNRKGNIKETAIEIYNERGAAYLGKPVGRYITLESPSLREIDESIYEPLVRILHEYLKDMLGAAKRVLVVGLGNRMVTPDSLGPLTVDNLLITRHLINEKISDGIRELSAIAPGVMAQTGIETLSIIKALVSEVKPELVIAVDALAAREPDRLGTTIQICDTGISPGSGVNNNRATINKETLGVDVVALGVPTVISVSAIVSRTLEALMDYSCELSDEDKGRLAKNILQENIATMFVSPKNIDESVKRISYTLSEAINRFFEL